MIHSLPNIPTHITPIHNRKSSSPQIITSEYFSLCCNPNKEGNPSRCLNPLNAFPWDDDRIRTSKLIIIRIDMEVPILFQLTPHTFPTLSWRVLVSKISRNSITNATYQSLKSRRNLTSQLPINGSLIQSREDRFKWMVTTPTVMPKSHPILHPIHKPSTMTKGFPTHSNVFPKTTTMWTPTLLGKSIPPPPFPNFIAIILLQNLVSSTPNCPNHIAGLV